MIIITIRSDKPEAELGIYRDQKQLAYDVWQAHRQLAETIHQHIDALLKQANVNLEAVEGIVVYKGPGSFTGLRIGLSVANALAYGLQVPIIGAQDDWIEHGIEQLLAGKSDKVALPEYGAPVHITQQKK
jgi:tRNA threonylcarbamoyladenosine biosynthesis protein TsaB